MRFVVGFQLSSHNSGAQARCATDSLERWIGLSSRRPMDTPAISCLHLMKLACAGRTRSNFNSKSVFSMNDYP